MDLEQGCHAETVSVTGGEVARKMYKRRGWVEHHNTTLWRDAQPVDNNAMPAFWPVGGAWMATHIWEHYEFTRDLEFLKRAYPVLRGASEFCADWLTDDGTSWPDDLFGGHHHMGTTRMAEDPRRGVVDADCRVYGVRNLYVAGSSVFPTSGAANPTLTVVALALRLADHLQGSLSS